MSQPDTATRILDAAEQLFAAQGFAQTSLRQITATAGVNLAAVNYHFGSKQALVLAVFTRFLDPFCATLALRMQQQSCSPQGQGGPDALAALLRMLISTMLELPPRRGQDLALFMRLLALAFGENQSELREALRERYAELSADALQRIASALPALTPLELFWRVHFALGALTFSLSGLPALRGIADQDFGVTTSTAQVLDLLMPFLLAGLRAGPTPDPE